MCNQFSHLVWATKPTADDSELGLTETPLWGRSRVVLWLEVFMLKPWLYLFEVANRLEKGQLCAYVQLLFKASGSEDAIKLWTETACTGNTCRGQLWETAAYPEEGNFSGTLRSNTFEWRGPWGLTFLLLASGLKEGSQPCHFIYG